MPQDEADENPTPPPADDPSAEQRRRARAARRAVPAPQRATAARQVADRLGALLGRRAPGAAGVYLPTDGELDPAFAVDLLRAAGWRLHLPVIGPGTSMRFAAWDERATLRENRYGIEEPDHDPAQLVAARSLDLLLVPCVAVDPRGHRLGFGAGYYDRALSDAEDPGMASSRPRPLLIGPVFDVQVVDDVPQQPWDVALDAVLCESATMLTGARAWPS